MVKSTDTVWYSSEIFQRSKVSMRWPLGKNLPVPPPPPPTSIYRYGFLWGWWWWWVVPWILSEMAPHNENFCEIFVPAAGLFLVTKQIQVTAVWICATCHFKKIVAVVPIYPLRITDVSIWSSRRSSDHSLRGLNTIRKIVREPGLSNDSRLLNL